jgi:hypothetical protein
MTLIRANTHRRCSSPGCSVLVLTDDVDPRCLQHSLRQRARDRVAAGARPTRPTPARTRVDTVARRDRFERDVAWHRRFTGRDPSSAELARLWADASARSAR